VDGGAKPNVGLLGAALSEVAGAENKLDPVDCLGTSPNKDDGAAEGVGCAGADVVAAGAEPEGGAGAPKENVGFCPAAPEVAAAPGAGGAEDSAGFEGAPKLKPPEAGLEANKPPGAVVDSVAAEVVAAGFPKLKAEGFAASSAGFAPNRPAPPVLAPKAELEGGGPAGVVEGLPKLKTLPPPLAAGVVDPNKDGADVEGVAVLSGVPKPPNAGFEPSLF
jgi:hypothetical protein